MTTESKPKTGLIVGIILLAGLVAVGGWVLVGRIKLDKSPASAIANSPLGEKVKQSIMPEEERLAYVKQHVTIKELHVDPDTKPGPDASVLEVKGLLRVTGIAENNGDKPVTPVRLILHLQDDTGGVLGTYIEDVTGTKPLEAGKPKSFRFTIPDKKDFHGKFLQEIR